MQILAFLIPCTAFFSFTPQTAAPKSSLRTIVIDAGHGGKDNGAPGKYSEEKNITLAIALKLGEILNKKLPDVKVVFTRLTDETQDVRLKAQIANEAKGDLFISIHCNSADPIVHSRFLGYKTVTEYTGKGKKRKKIKRRVKNYKYYTTPNPAYGTETHLWRADKMDDKQRAMRDNQDWDNDTSITSMANEFDALSPDQKILLNLKTQQYFQRSTHLAFAVEEEFKKVGRHSRDARQREKGIWVLQATAMPSILVETGFLSNPEDEKYLNSEEGQTETANAIAEAVVRYKELLDSHQLRNGQPVLESGSDR